MSNALLKSFEITTTYGLSSSILVIVSNIDIIAAVGEPEGLMANWLDNARFVVGDKRAGYRKCQTVNRSKMWVTIGVTEIGLKLAGCDGDGTLE